MSNDGIIRYCNTPQCKICRLNVLDTDIDFYSNLAVKKYTFNGEGSCKSKNCIYLISCKHPGCQMKYVGFTTTPLNKRLSGHRANIINKTEGVVIAKHFTKVHNITDMIIKPLEYCDGKVLRAKEKFYMQELNTIFPYGLNNRIDIGGIHDASQHVESSSNVPIYTLFNFVKINRTKRGSRSNNTNNTNIHFSATSFINDLAESNTQHLAKKSRLEIMRLKIKTVHELLIHISYLLITQAVIYQGNEYLLLILRDLCLQRIHKSKPTTKGKYDRFFIVNYANRLMEQVYINNIIHRNSSYALFPVNKEYLQRTGVSYKYSNTIRSKVTNYKKTVLNGMTDNVQCACNDHQEFIDQHHGHIITGNLQLIQNTEVRNLLKKGLNYREMIPTKLVYNKAYNGIVSATDKFIIEASTSLKIPVHQFSPWKCYILNTASDYLNNSTINYNTPVLSKRINQDYLNTLHSKFVIAPVDKTSANVSLICKQFYLQVLHKEIIESGNFENSILTVNDILQIYTTKLNNLGDYTKYANNLPFMYWIPKFHKNPIGFRFITSGKHTYINGLAKVLGICLKSLLDAAKTHDNFHSKFSSIKKYFIIDSNKNVIKFMNTANLMNIHKSLHTFDFQTLYTKIPLDKLKDSVIKFITYVFEIKKRKFLNVCSKSAIFSDTKSKTRGFSKDELIEHLNFSIDNAFICNSNSLYRQCIGIGMGRNDASHLANIFLHTHEKSFIENTLPETIHSFGDLFRYQDDLIGFGMQLDNNSSIQNIYPNEMIIKNTNILANKVSYLDLEISVLDNNYTYKSYDKRKDFNFPIIKYPHIDSNIPINPAYGVFTSQLIRFCDINLLIEDFKKDVIELVNILKSQGFKLNMLRNKFIQFAKENIVRWSHFGVNLISTDFFNSLIA